MIRESISLTKSLNSCWKNSWLCIRRSAPYHPQANGQAESSNKTLCTALTKIVSESRTDWEQKLSSVLWAYRTAYKTAVGATPFDLVYGINAILPMEFLLPTLRVAKELNGQAMSCPNEWSSWSN